MHFNLRCKFLLLLKMYSKNSFKTWLLFVHSFTNRRFGKSKIVIYLFVYIFYERTTTFRQYMLLPPCRKYITPSKTRAPTGASLLNRKALAQKGLHRTDWKGIVSGETQFFFPFLYEKMSCLIWIRTRDSTRNTETLPKPRKMIFLISQGIIKIEIKF